MDEAWDLEVWTPNRRFGMILPRERLSEMLRFCRKAGDRETGGILIGRYTDALDLAIVHEITGPPTDSAFGRTWFHRGWVGLQTHLLQRWRISRDYYLGEWHFHPGSSPLPSFIDQEQMKKISSTFEYQCPEPILLILGGNPRGKWAISARVYPRGEQPQEMTESRPTNFQPPVSE